MLLANDPPSMLVPKAKPRDNNSIFYYYFYSVNLPNNLLMPVNLDLSMANNQGSSSYFHAITRMAELYSRIANDKTLYCIMYTLFFILIRCFVYAVHSPGRNLVATFLLNLGFVAFTGPFCK